jgi:hypothetical protein
MRFARFDILVLAVSAIALVFWIWSSEKGGLGDWPDYTAF